MREANFFAVFVGIESPDPETLRLMKKKQNTRRSIPESIHKIYGAGMFVNAGFIVGFDSERAAIADAMVELIEEAAIPVAMVGLLYALPNTQLTRRLTQEGRLQRFRSWRRRKTSARRASTSRRCGRGAKSCRTTATS